MSEFKNVSNPHAGELNPSQIQKIKEKEEDRYEKEERLVDEIIAKVTELANLLKQDREELLRRGINDMQGLDGFIDDILREIIKKFRESGYALPNSCYYSECELFKEEE